MRQVVRQVSEGGGGGCGTATANHSEQAINHMRQLSHAAWAICTCVCSPHLLPPLLRRLRPASLATACPGGRSHAASQVLHLSGGVFGWYKSNMPFDGEYDTSNVGRTPNAAEDGTAFAPNSQNKQ